LDLTPLQLGTVWSQHKIEIYLPIMYASHVRIKEAKGIFHAWNRDYRHSIYTQHME
jgi:hypothetical protein